MLIYKATNKVNGKVYVGQTIKSLESRIFEHYKASKKPKSKFHKAIQKWGILGFEWSILVDNVQTKEELDKTELYYQHQYNVVEEGYNMVYMAGGGVNTAAIETNRQRRGKTWDTIYTAEGLQVMKNKVLPNFVEVGTPYRFDQIPKELQKQYASKGGKSHKGKKESEQTKRNISQGLKSSEKFQKMKQEPEYKKQRSEDSKANWDDPDSVYNTLQYRDKLSKAKKARFERAWAEIKPKLENLLENKVPKMQICRILSISHPTLQKYISLIK